MLRRGHIFTILLITVSGLVTFSVISTANAYSPTAAEEDLERERQIKECIKKVEADDSLTHAEKVVAKRDCQTKTFSSQESTQEEQGEKTFEEIGKKWVADCEEYIERYILVGEQSYYAYYGTSYILRSCEKIYLEGLWEDQGNHKFEQIGLMFEGGELEELEAGRAEREKNKMEAIVATRIPDWIRNNAEWWVQGAIGDSDFVSGIQYLIKQDIIRIPQTVQSTSTEGSDEIPSWIKNNADWWSQGLISDDDFVKGIQYLIEQGIIRV